MCNLYSLLRNLALSVSLPNLLLFSHPKTYNKLYLKIFTPNARNKYFFSYPSSWDFPNVLANIFTHFHVTTVSTFENSIACHLFTPRLCIFYFNDIKSHSQEYITLCLFLIESKALGFFSPSILSPGLFFQLSEIYHVFVIS